MNSALFEQIRRIASDVFSVPQEEINGGSSPESLERWDSIQHLNFVLALEERFHFQLTPEEIEQMRNIEQVAKVVEVKLQTMPR